MHFKNHDSKYYIEGQKKMDKMGKISNIYYTQRDSIPNIEHTLRNEW